MANGDWPPADVMFFKLYNDAWLRETGIIGPDEGVADYDWRATHPEVIVRRAS